MTRKKVATTLEEKAIQPQKAVERGQCDEEAARQEIIMMARAEEIGESNLTDLEYCEHRAREIAGDRLKIEHRSDMTLFLDGEKILFKVIPGCEENAASIKAMREGR
jgi:hypothetical protein